MMQKDEISRLIPHDGKMSLIERVVSFDKTSIVCESETQHDESNPLRSGGHLSALNAIEYGAQAMALHGALNGEKDAQSYLVSVRSIELQTDYLDRVAAPLSVHATLQVRDAKAALYKFRVMQNDHELASGRLTIAYGVEVEK